jgi:hypothetical protein
MGDGHFRALDLHEPGYCVVHSDLGRFCGSHYEVSHI